jgi:hypothetical protein
LNGFFFLKLVEIMIKRVKNIDDLEIHFNSQINLYNLGNFRIDFKKVVFIKSRGKFKRATHLKKSTKPMIIRVHLFMILIS